ncbi:Fic family protein [Alkalilimnicola ehrlichii MLHE-1]|uniref:Protein adenylyltransferase n=1 Tax=Alkalilimnicola ehrlichii (strain ATCC BAA-1101 / DSM 17681 / MLHE-1) TaxID=187272 RepID=Q0ABC4_ALKEH|nr:Fic family protein [Alkalilimnicola ehrlichii]ABI55863.1 filamentation induced by cAMP protein Fic [Alkalilimnicola ehrlichii MLHE-1]
MQRGPAGTFVERHIGGERVRTFAPYPLPPDPGPQITGDRARLHEQALLACGRLDAITMLLPEPDLFLYAYVRREALVSSQIEGTQSSFSDLLLFELEEAAGVPFHDVVEVSNYVAALDHGLARIGEGFPLSNRLLREMHAHLLSRGRGAERQPGAFRRSQNWIGGTRPGNAHFVPPAWEEVEDHMAGLERFIHDRELPFSALVKAALAHVQFETIHPFLDGNGRIGRLLIALILHQEGVLHQPLLYLSLYFKQHRAEYYRLLDQTRNVGDWEAWLDFFLDGVLVTATGAVDTAHRLLALFAEDQQRIEALGRAAANTLRIYQALRTRPLANINDLASRAGVSFPTASRAVAALERLGILREITGRSRDRIYAYDRYITILNEGAEPL